MVESALVNERTEKPWGYELLITCNNQYACKILNVFKGHRLSLQYHKEKHETMYIYSGEGWITLDGVVNRAGKGCICEIPPMTKHRVEAVTDMTIFEASTPELDDVVRVEDDYGR